ncbi:hypothetical protein ACFY93_10515 [Streptomyces sp. NPDC008313]|uniref:hypothetical protein n=1 Tax=Streptomyces sp. NPDC008313 TaxID=3364826 RepID=UPI0036E60EB3
MTAAAYDTESDAAFFADITEVFGRHPRAAERYALASLDLERELGIDLTQKFGVSRIEDGRIVTEFHDRKTEPPERRLQLCVKYEMRGGELVCVDWREAEE